MTDSFPELSEILKTGHIPTDTSHFLETCQRRLLDALRDSPKSADIASLVRHVLRREDELQGVTSQTLLKVPRSNPFPDRNIWKQVGITVLGEDSNYYLISANAWQPEWLDFSTEYPPDVPLSKEEIRRSYEPVTGDPFLELVQLDAYLSNRYLSNNNTSNVQRLILLPVSTPDPKREDRLLMNIFSGQQFKFEIFCTEISI